MSLKALILVGGYGTRLRPLTLSVPKPLVEFCNMPMLEHQVAALSRVGVTDIVLAVSYLPEKMDAAVADFESKYNVRIVLSKEDEPLGTAGPLALARPMLEGSDTFFVLNSDVVCEFDLATMLAFHRKHGHEGTIAVTQVDEPSRYGVIVCRPDSSAIECFVEKPRHFVSNLINAGIYIFQKSILSHIPLRPTSIEKEIFPKRAEAGELYAWHMPGFWMDVGEPPAFIAGAALHIAYLRLKRDASLAEGPNIEGGVIVHPTAKVSPSCRIGPNTVIGPNVVIEDGARVKSSVVLANSRIAAHAFVANSIVGWNSSVGKWSRVEGCTVLGEDVHVKDEVHVNNSRVLPHKTIDSNIATGGIFM